MRSLILIFLFFLNLQVFAQDKYFEKLPKVSNSDYYNIALSQEIIGVANKYGFSKLRLRDENNRDIPYFLRFKNDLKPTEKYIDKKIIENKSDAENSFVIIENNDELETLYIQIKSLEVYRKTIQIRGSHDGKKWFLVKAKTSISESGHHFDSYDDVFEISFPKGSYRYYQLELSNEQKLPIEILSVKKIEQQEPHKYPSIEISLGKLVQIDSSNKTTLLRFPDLEQTYYIEKLDFDISSTQNYFRKAHISDSYIYFNLSSKNDNIIETKGFLFDNESSLIIDNDDSTPLVINNVKAYGDQVYMCAYIEENKSIEVYLDPKLKDIPNYDINHFKDDISKDLKVLSTFDFVKITEEKSDLKYWFESESFMWLAIIVVGIFLLWTCFRIAKDVKNKDK